MVKRLVDAPAFRRAPLDRLKCIVYGGGPMYVADCKAAFAVVGPRLAQIYGQGESPMTITAMGRALLADAIARGDDARIASVGCAQTGIEVVIADPDGAALPAGAVGEVLVRGPTVMRGYWRNPDASAAALAHGWLHTGDLGALDGDGFLTLFDRSKDLIISGGSNIYPREVEEVLLLHPDVAEVAVIGRRHAEWGEEVVACVVARRPLPDAARDAGAGAGARRAVPRADRAVQAPQGVRVRGGTSEEQHGQGPEDRAARIRRGARAAVGVTVAGATGPRGSVAATCGAGGVARYRGRREPE